MDAVYAILKAMVAHLYLAWTHPFGDGNGRTARLIEFHILLSAGVPSPAAHLFSNHYNQTRAEYYRQLDRASKSGGHPFLSATSAPSNKKRGGISITAEIYGHVFPLNSRCLPWTNAISCS
jgi:hypothetical protein